MDITTISASLQNSSSTQLQNAVDNFQIAQGYFSDIIQSQTAIFSLIVAAIVALYFLFNWKISKDYIKKEMDVHFKEIKEQSDKEFNEKMANLEKTYSTAIAQHEKEIGRLAGNNYRTLGQFWDSEKKYNVAFVWWFRGAGEFAKISDERLTRVCLSRAKNSVERVGYGLELNSNAIGEYQKILPEIPDIYKIEKDLVDKALKEILEKKP